MKSELRHKLQRNALADWLVETGQTLKPYQNHLTILAIGVLALLVAYSVLSHASATRAAQAWEQVDAGLYGKPEALAKVAEENRNSPAGQMAAVLAADTYLYEGCELEFRNKAEARDALKKAIQLYESPELSSGRRCSRSGPSSGWRGPRSARATRTIWRTPCRSTKKW